MQISKVGIDIIKSFEGCQLKAYKCPAGVWTIGWGTTEPIAGKKICEGMTITQKQADDLLISNLKSYENAVNKYVTVGINQNQYDALVSFTYNCGCGALQKSTLLKYVNAKKFDLAAEQFHLWNKGGGVVLKGLVRRRKAEAELFLKRVTTNDTQLINAVDKLAKKGILSNPNMWNDIAKMNMSYVPSLLSKMGGINRLYKEHIITDTLIWEKQTYKPNHVRDLLIKYSILA